MPYFSTQGTNSDNESIYRLDSVYGSDPIKLTAFRSNYFLNSNSTPDLENGAVYYSDDIAEFNGVEGDTIFSETFTPSNDPFVAVVPADSEDQDDARTTLSPRLRLRLDQNSYGETYWQTNILDRGGDDELFNANAFRNYFRGIYLKAEPVETTGSYFLFDKSNTSIVIYYKNGAEASRRSASLTLSFSGGSVIGYENDFNASIKAELTGILVSMSYKVVIKKSRRKSLFKRWSG